jgi:hypothetical protein
MVVPFPANAFNIQVLATGQTPTGNTIERVGSVPPATGMKIFYNFFPVTPQRYIVAIDQNTGLITVAVSGAAGQQLFNRNYGWELNILASDAKGYGWPTGANSNQFQTQTFTYPTASPRGTDFLPGTGFLHG